MRQALWKFGRWIGLVVILGVIVLAAGLFLPLSDENARDELAKVEIGDVEFDGAIIAEAVTYLEARIRESGATNLSIRLDENVVAEDLPTITLTLENMTVYECARYISELSSTYIYSNTDGIIIDYFHRDHRSVRRKFRDWIRYELLWRWYGRPSSIP